MTLVVAFHPHHDEFPRIGVQELLQAPGFPIGGVLVEEQVMAVVHVDDGVAFFTATIIVRQVKMDGPPQAAIGDCGLEFLDHTR